MNGGPCSLGPLPPHPRSLHRPPHLGVPLPIFLVQRNLETGQGLLFMGGMGTTKPVQLRKPQLRAQAGPSRPTTEPLSRLLSTPHGSELRSVRPPSTAKSPHQQGLRAEQCSLLAPAAGRHRPCQHPGSYPTQVTFVTPRGPGMGLVLSCHSRRLHTHPLWCYPHLQIRKLRLSKNNMSKVKACCK